MYEGDTFGYDYNINVRRAKLWANYAQTIGKLHYMVAGRVGYDNMYRVGNMRMVCLLTTLLVRARMLTSLQVV